MSLLPERQRALLQVRLAVLRAHLDARGFGWLVSRALRRVLLETAWIGLLPAAVLLHLAGFRRVIVRTEHIGHLATEPDAFFKELQLGLLRRRRWFTTVPPQRCSNAHLLDYWRRYLRVITAPAACAFLELLTRRWLARDDLDRYVARFFGTQDIYRINRLWGARPPLLALSDADAAWWDGEGRRSLGIPPDRWFVCVHVREGGFLPHNELIQSHRNASIANALAAMREVVARGGICVRMGDATMTPLAPAAGVVDYAHHPAKSARMDVVLCAKARLFLGCTSGLAFVSAIFGVPVAHANMIPVATLGIRACDLSIPKRVRRVGEQRDLGYPEILGSAIGDYFFSHQYRDAGLVVEENSADEILQLLREALDRISGTWVEEPGDRALQERYLGLFRPGHYSYGAASRIGADFLRRHRDLL